MTMSNSKQADVSRREVLAAAGGVAAASVLAGVALPQVHAQGNDLIKVALVGCGGRGTGAAINALATPGQTRLVAMADVFQNKLNSSYNQINQGNRVPKVDVPNDRKFIGFDGYRRAMDC